MPQPYSPFKNPENLVAVPPLGTAAPAAKPTDPSGVPAAPAKSQLIVTSGPARTTFNNNVSSLDAAERSLGIYSPQAPTTAPAPIVAPPTQAPGETNQNPATPSAIPSAPATNTSNPINSSLYASDPVIQSLEGMKANSDVATQSLIGSAQATYQNSLNSLNKAYESYKGGLQLLGIQHNEAQATPELLMGHIQQATLDQINKVNEINATLAKTILDGRLAQKNSDFKTAADIATRIETLNKEKNDAVKEIHDIVKSSAETAKVEAHDIYDTLQKLSPDAPEGQDSDQMKLIKAVAEKFKISIADLITSIADEKKLRDKADLAITNTKSIITKRNTPKAPKTGPGSKVTVQSASAQLDKTIPKVLGGDNYMDPDTWVTQRDTWVKNRLPIATFNTLYKKYLNPKSYAKAGFTVAKKKS